MEATLIEVATTQGIWVLLFVSLFIYTIKRYEAMEEKQETREKEYQKLLNELTEKFCVLSEIKEDTGVIKEKLQ